MINVCRRNSFRIGFLFVLLVVTVATVYAGSNETRNTNFAGITTAVARKYVSTDTLHSKLNCSTYSLTQYPTVNITHIGYNTFGCTAYRSDGRTYQWTSSVGELNYNASNHGKIKTITAPGLTYGHRDGVSAGKHDFGHYDGTSYNWDPSLSAQETFYP